MRWSFLAAIFWCAVAVAACGDSPTTPSASGNFRLMLTDSPFSDARAVLVTFSSVSVHRADDGGFATLPLEGGSRTCDLKKLQGGAQDVLGVGSLAAGHYTQIRLAVSRAVIYFDNPSAGSACAPSIAAPGGRSETVEIPSGTIRLNREFDVTANGATTMVLDFDGDRSIHQTGNGRYMMTPVIHVTSVQ